MAERGGGEIQDLDGLEDGLTEHDRQVGWLITLRQQELRRLTKR